MWQVYIVQSDGYETWRRPVDGELFATEAEANARADYLDRWCYLSGDYHIVDEE